MHIQLAFRNVDADNGRRPSYPLFAQAGFAGGPSDCSGSMERLAKTTLGHPRDCGVPEGLWSFTSHRTGYYAQVDGFQVTRGTAAAKPRVCSGVDYAVKPGK